MRNSETAEQIEKRDPALAAMHREEGAQMERDRYKGIEAVASELGPEHQTLIMAMKSDGRYTGADLAKVAVISRQQQGGSNFSGDRLKVQRDANADWAASQPLRMAFDNNQSAYVAFRVTASQMKKGTV